MISNMLDILSEKRRKINWKKKDYTKYNRERQKSVSAPIPLYPKKKNARNGDRIDENFGRVITKSENKGGTKGERGKEWEEK